MRNFLAKRRPVIQQGLRLMDNMSGMCRSSECAGMVTAGRTGVSEFCCPAWVAHHEASAIRAQFSELIAQFAVHCSFDC